mmetsp:Transcript_102787/g.257856  ORF Transcript_102787/g.257856 Transcript_102787/m.257856 type:complete len:416 (+) Transcript_102787:109-1356(+)
MVEEVLRATPPTSEYGSAGAGAFGDTADPLPNLPGMRQTVEPGKRSEEEMLEREVARRRQLELERRARIFDAKRRTIGVDKEFLDQQCAENAARRQQAAAAQRIEDRELLGVNMMLQLAEKEKQRMRHDAEKSAKEFSLHHLNFSSRREFDINDPKAVTKSLPARAGDEDPRCGPASMQQFNGEDLFKEERDRQQKLATVNALEQQIFEKQMLKRMSDDGDADFAQQSQDIIDLRNEVEASEASLRRELMGNYQQGLKDRIAANAAAKHAEAEANQDANQRELDFHASDQFLNESRPHIHPNGKVEANLYKGSTQAERVDVFRQQLEQCNENLARKSREGMSDKAHNNHLEMTRRQLVMMEREKSRMRRQMAGDVAGHNKAMLAQQKDLAKKLGPDGHRNVIAPEFFEQFGVGTR